jgi:tetrahydromethanopterin S-methyltransferase subunit B
MAECYSFSQLLDGAWLGMIVGMIISAVIQLILK